MPVLQFILFFILTPIPQALSGNDCETSFRAIKRKPEALNLLFFELDAVRNSNKKIKHLKAMDVNLYKAINAFPEIVKFVQKTKPSSEHKDYNDLVMEAVIQTFNKHVPAFLDTHTFNKDWARINLILNEIANFDPKKGNFSFYKIKRAIEGRYSLKEYILCKK